MLTDPMDSFMLMGLRKYGDYDLQNVAAPDLELPSAEKAPKDEPQLDKLPEEAIGRTSDGCSGHRPVEKFGC